MIPCADPFNKRLLLVNRKASVGLLIKWSGKNNNIIGSRAKFLLGGGEKYKSDNSPEILFGKTFCNNGTIAY